MATVTLTRQEQPDTFVSITQLTPTLGVSRPVVHRLIEAGDLQAVKIGKQWRISRRSLDAYLARASAVRG